MNVSDLSPAARSSSTVDITREDLASVVAVYKRESKRLNLLGALGMLGGVVVAVTMIGIGQIVGMIDDWIPLFLLITYALAATALVLEWVYRRRMVDGIQIVCAGCGAPLLGSGNPTRVASFAQMTVVTGRCSDCGRSFIANEA